MAWWEALLKKGYSLNWYVSGYMVVRLRHGLGEMCPGVSGYEDIVTF